MTKYMIHGVDRSLLHCFVDCAHNILEGNIPLGHKEKKRLGKHKDERALRKRIPLTDKRNKFCKRGASCLPDLCPNLS